MRVAVLNMTAEWEATHLFLWSAGLPDFIQPKLISWPVSAFALSPHRPPIGKASLSRLIDVEFPMVQRRFPSGSGARGIVISFDETPQAATPRDFERRFDDP